MELQTQINDARAVYMKECKRIAGIRWDECDEAYSFDAAYDEGTSAEDAVRDCIAWLDT